MRKRQFLTDQQRISLGLSRTNRMFSVFYTMIILQCVNTGKNRYKDILAVFEQCGSPRDEEWLSTRVYQMENDMMVVRNYVTAGEFRRRIPTLALTEVGEVILSRYDKEWTRMVQGYLLASEGKSDVMVVDGR